MNFLTSFPSLSMVPTHSLLALISSLTDLLIHLLISYNISLLVFKCIVFLTIIYLLLVISQRICDLEAF